MAIYQYYLAFIPKIGLLKKNTTIPNQININTETEYIETNIDEYWELAKISFRDLKLDIDKIVDKDNLGNDIDSFNWKTFTNEMDNDAWMSINPNTQIITEFSFRADLRESGLTFLNGMLKLAKKYDMILMDKKGNLMNPEFNEIKEFIKLSNTFKFLENPVKFLDDLNEGKINIK